MRGFTIAFAAALALLTGPPAQAKNSPPVIGYVAAFKGLDRIVDEADFSRYTHVDLAFVNPGRDGSISVGGALACAPDGKGGANVSPRSLRRLVEAAHRAGAKVLVSVGGGVIPPCSGDWAQLLEPQTRDKIVAGLVALIDEYAFDGLDVDLEGDLMTRIDKAGNYTPFVAAISAALRARGKLLTCATASYEGGMVPDSSLTYFDLVGIMSYDAIGPTWGEAGSEHSTYAQAERDLRLWIGKGVPLDKLALGVPFYGYGFGRYRRNYAFDEIATQFGRAARRGDVVGRLCAGCDYVTYNGLDTLHRKAELAGAWGAGVMVWEIDQDTPDHRLVRTLRDALQKGARRARRGRAMKGEERMDPKRERLLSLDMMRGLAVMGMILVNSMAGIASEGNVFPTLLHSHWDGVTLADVVFPMFLMMVGVSIPLSLRNADRLSGEESSRILWRTFRLVLLGWMLSNFWWVQDFSASSWRLFGVLQRIGLVYGACAFLFLLTSPRTRLIIIALVLILYWPLSLLPALDGLPNDIWARGHNFVASVDRVLLGAGNHNYVQGPEGYDPEGLLGTLPAIAHGLIGVAVGEFLLRRRAGDDRRLAIAGAAMLAAGIAWGFLFPVIKDIWSSSFVLVTCGISILTLALLHWIYDRGHALDGVRKVAAFIVLPFGVNAIAAYVLHEVTGAVLGWDLLLQPYAMARGAVGPELAAFIPVAMYIFGIWLAMFYLWKKRWIIKI